MVRKNWWPEYEVTEKGPQISMWINWKACTNVCIDKEKGSRFCLVKGQMSQMDLTVEVSERSILFKRLVLEVGMWPKRKCQRSAATIQYLINELRRKHSVDWSGGLWRWYRPDSASASPIVLHFLRSYIIHFVWRKNKPIVLSAVNLETEMRLILKDGT